MQLLRLAMISVGCVLFLVGCQSDEKEAENIQDKLNEAAVYEENFQDNQESLEAYRDKEQSIYEDIIQGDIQERDAILEQADEGKTCLKKQNELVIEGQDYMEKAYETSTSIKSNIEQIEDKQEQDQAAELLNVIKERKGEIESYFDLYEDQLHTLYTFYEALESDDVPLDDMSQQIDEVNDTNEDMEDHLKSFNQATETYNEEEAAYYNIVEEDA